MLVSILTRESVNTQWAIGYRNLQIPGGVQFMAGMPFDHARNNACRAALDNGYTWLFFLDDDTVPPPDAITRLMAHKKDIVSGLYYRRNDPLLPVMLRYTDAEKIGTNYVADFSWPALIEVDLVGAGCLLIHRRVLEAFDAKLPKPWFEWLTDRLDLPPHARKSEDFEFCVRAQARGYKIYVDTAVQCRHIGFGKAWINGNKPEYTPLVVQA